MQRQRAALGRPRHQPDKRRHQAHLRPGQPAAKSHPSTRPLPHEAQIQGRTNACQMCYFPAGDIFHRVHIQYIMKLPTMQKAAIFVFITVVKGVGKKNKTQPDLSTQRRSVQLPRSVSDHRADRPVLWRHAPRRLRRRQARLHPHISRTLLRVSRGHQVPAELCGHQVRKAGPGPS